MRHQLYQTRYRLWTFGLQSHELALHTQEFARVDADAAQAVANQGMAEQVIQIYIVYYLFLNGSFYATYAQE